jgi:hypothetical protein
MRTALESTKHNRTYWVEVEREVVVAGWVVRG